MADTTMNRHALSSLRRQLRGTLLVPGDSEYDTAREIWNRLHDRRPSVIVRCTAISDIASAVRFARENDLDVAIKAGGHHAAGYASIEGGLLVDLSLLRGIEVDPIGRRAVAQAGLTWAQFDQVTQSFGLACTGPIVSMTGVAGFTLGGGMGWLQRKLGLGCDNLISAEVVTAEGKTVTASNSENSDLLWGLCGGGWNFGIVASMEFRLHAIGPNVVAGLIYFPLNRLPALVAHHRALSAGFPDELTTWLFLRLAPPVPAIPPQWVGKPVVALVLCHCGPTDQGMAWARKLAEFDSPIANTVAELEYRNWQRALDSRWGNGFFNDWRGHYFNDLGQEPLEILMDRVSRLTSPWTDIKIPHLGGAIARPPATAFGTRDANFALVIQARWERAADSQNQMAWARELRDALAPHATGRSYTNFLAADENDRVRAAYDSQAYRKLQALKSTYDPTNFFHNNPNIPPGN
jgi:FAD/FMN-containing dehydrogenase